MLLATILALTSAGLHAGWNLMVKTSEDRDLASLGQFAVGGTLAFVALLVVGFPEADTLPFLALSALVHVGYLLGLVKAYDHGDFSLAYPLARGGGAVLAAIGGVVLLGDELTAVAWLAIAVVMAGLLSLLNRHAGIRSVGWAIWTAVTIGTYTVIDSHGARIASSGASYGFALIASAGLAITLVGVLRGRGTDLVATVRTSPLRHLGAGACLTAAYTLVLVAVRYAPVGYVTMLRESSVVLGAAAGWLLLEERLGARRVASSGVIVCGLVMLVIVNN